MPSACSSFEPPACPSGLLQLQRRRRAALRDFVTAAASRLRLSHSSLAEIRRLFLITSTLLPRRSKAGVSPAPPHNILYQFCIKQSSTITEQSPSPSIIYIVSKILRLLPKNFRPFQLRKIKPIFSGSRTLNPTFFPYLKPAPENQTCIRSIVVDARPRWGLARLWCAAGWSN